MRRRRSNFWVYFIGFIFFTGFLDMNGGVFLGLVMMMLFMTMMFSLGRNESIRSRHRMRMSMKDTAHSDADIAKINLYLKDYFRDGQYRLPIGSEEELFLRSAKYKSLDDLDVYVKGRRFGTLYEYRVDEGLSYNRLMAELLQKASSHYQSQTQSNTYSSYQQQASSNPVHVDNNVIDVEVEEVKPAYAYEQSQEKINNQNYLDPKNEKYINQLDELNLAIPDEEISTKMYETTALLKQLDFYQKRFPNSNVDFDKMYEYYLPLLISILDQYKNLQVAKNDSNYNQIVENLKKTLTKVNQALRKMIEDMTDEDFLNLSVDMSTLEALLKKDGYDTSNQMKQHSKEESHE